MGRRRQERITFRVTETEIVDPERVARGLEVWADCLARQLIRRRLAARQGARSPQAPPDE